MGKKLRYQHVNQHQLTVNIGVKIISMFRNKISKDFIQNMS